MTFENQEFGSSVTREIAEQEFDRIVKFARVKWEKYAQFAGNKDADAEREMIIDAIMDGYVSVDDEGRPTVHTAHENENLKEIKIVRRPIKADKLAMDRVKEGQDQAKELATLGKFLCIAPSALGQLEEADYNVLSTLWFLFLGYRV